MRDAIIIFIAIILSMAIGSYLFFNGAPDLSSPPPIPSITRSNNEVMVIAEGQNAGSMDRRTNYRITSDAELVALWNMVYTANAPAVPAVDFANYEVLAIFDGSHSSGGYDVSVSRVEDKDGQRTVYIRREAPGEGCITTEAITSPFEIVRVSKTLLPMTKVEENVTKNCN